MALSGVTLPKLNVQPAPTLPRLQKLLARSCRGVGRKRFPMDEFKIAKLLPSCGRASCGCAQTRSGGVVSESGAAASESAGTLLESGATLPESWTTLLKAGSIAPKSRSTLPRFGIIAPECGEATPSPERRPAGFGETIGPGTHDNGVGRHDDGRTTISPAFVQSANPPSLGTADGL